ncbi:MAG: molybdate ABC transporter permease subunit [Planctomycetes bacterium]|nr:molybdate ABC transporter permease subunit [Planctomycetota bacterium]
MRARTSLSALALLGLVCAAQSAGAEEIRVAVAANFLRTGQDLAEEFERDTGHRVVLSSGSTGALLAQIEHGATYDVFLAADTRSPAALKAAGRARWRFSYATGRLALVGAGVNDPAQGEATLRRGSFRNLAIANPATAPYGAAAREALTRLGLWAELQPKLVLGQSVAQAHQIARSGGAELGLVAWSQAKASGQTAWLLPSHLHAPLLQEGVLLTERAPARAFCAFLKASKAQALISAAGYDPPARSGLEPTRVEASESRGPWDAIVLTLKLALTTTVILLLLSTPLAWWLGRGRSLGRTVVEALVALPLVLPPTVLGFYLLVLLGPEGLVGGIWEALGGPRLVFSFGGLVVGSVLYSLPFVVQPLQAGFRAIDPTLLEAAATLGSSPLDRFRCLVLPLTRPSYLVAATLGFAHTIGEFGVVLMIGGSVPAETRVLSIAIYEQVEQLHYDQAHLLAGGMLAFSFLILLAVYLVERRFQEARP